MKIDNKLSEILDGRTKKWLSDQTGIHRNTLTNYFNNVMPPLDNAYLIAEALGKSVYEIWVPKTR